MRHVEEVCLLYKILLFFVFRREYNFFRKNDEFLDDIELIEGTSTHGDTSLNEKCNFSSSEEYSNGFSDDEHFPRKTMGSLEKGLRPYLDVVDNKSENEETYAIDRQLKSESFHMQNSVSIRDIDNSMKVALKRRKSIMLRLRALESNKEFLHHYMGPV